MIHIIEFGSRKRRYLFSSEKKALKFMVNWQKTHPKARIRHYATEEMAI